MQRKILYTLALTLSMCSFAKSGEVCAGRYRRPAANAKPLVTEKEEVREFTGLLMTLNV